MDKCNQQLCSNAAKQDAQCASCKTHFCGPNCLGMHMFDEHKDTGLVSRGKRTQPVLMEK